MGWLTATVGGRVLGRRLRLRRVPLVAPGAQRQERECGHERAGAATVTPAIEHAGHSSGENDLQTNTQQSRAAKGSEGCSMLL